ncbi:hypothetical protein FQN54_006923 [Arachnomyces sp. PD_36]|nr:hypothetical protein FQN54_006923 [Arachnomyces sp. PD_36]
MAVRTQKDKSINLNGGVIRLLVGNPPIPFAVLKELIRGSSDFFDKAMSSDWKESKSRVFALPNHDPEALQLYMQWLYTKMLPVKTEDPSDDEFLLLAKAVVLGDMFQDSDFENTAVDAILDKSRSSRLEGPTLAPTVSYIYENTINECKARKLLVDIYVSEGNGKWLRHPEESPKDLPSEFMFDLAAALLERRPKPNSSSPSSMTDTCRYHKHSSGGTCDKNKFSRKVTSTRRYKFGFD